MVGRDNLCWCECVCRILDWRAERMCATLILGSSIFLFFSFFFLFSIFPPLQVHHPFFFSPFFFFFPLLLPNHVPILLFPLIYFFVRVIEAGEQAKLWGGAVAATSGRGTVGMDYGYSCFQCSVRCRTMLK